MVLLWFSFHQLQRASHNPWTSHERVFILHKLLNPTMCRRKSTRTSQQPFTMSRILEPLQRRHELIPSHGSLAGPFPLPLASSVYLGNKRSDVIRAIGREGLCACVWCLAIGDVLVASQTCLNCWVVSDCDLADRVMEYWQLDA